VTRHLDFPERYRALPEPLFRRHAPEHEVLAFGSRVSGTAQASSDLDPALRDPTHPRRACAALPALRAVLSESAVPLSVSLLDWALIPETFRDEILRCHIVLFSPVRP
jgi:predicted nucleotidyltransferase